MNLSKSLLLSLGVFITGSSLQAQQWLYSNNNAYYNSGHVGIGTSSPSTNWSKVLQVYDPNNASLSVKTPVADWQMVTAASGALGFYNITGGLAQNRLQISSDGNIGVGSINPTAKLAINGDLGIEELGIQKYHADYYNGGFNIAESHVADYRLFIKDGGNIGIGTGTPSSKLSVVTNGLGSNNGDRMNLSSFETGVGNNTSFVDLYSYRNASGNDWLSATTRFQQRIDGVNMGYIEFNPPGMIWGLALGTNNTGRLFIDNNGNVGIGTKSIGDNTYGLFVEKGIRTRKVKVDVAVWSDYVFHSGYRLRPLSEVEHYIEQHHHLPEVPSEAEVKRDGLDLGDNQATLLKKIEELTLYLIDVNKKVEHLQQENLELKKLVIGKQIKSTVKY